jgi:hypothetical protein
MLQTKELNSSNVSQRINTLLALEEQKIFLGKSKREAANSEEVF